MEIVLLVPFFELAPFAGSEIITNVPSTLHTSWMSGTNAISGITLVGVLASAKLGSPTLAAGLGFVAIVLATINVVGGFLVTHRILNMFRRRGKRPTPTPPTRAR